MNVPEHLLYTPDHEWINPETGAIGITDFAQDQLGDVVFLEVVAEEGADVAQKDSLGTIESVKTVSDAYAPVSGKVTAVNGELDASPELINESPYENGWLVKIEFSDRSQLDALLTPAAYKEQIGS
jgi:glycine cleavage system H protein